LRIGAHGYLLGKLPMVSPATISVTRPDPHVVVVSLSGDHDLASAHDAVRTFEELVEAGCAVVVDLSGLTFLDTTTVHALVVGRRLAAAAGTAFVVHLPAAHPARRMLDLMRVLDVVPLPTTLDDAIGAARASRAAGRTA
jgi:anti-sigma B factor antagonist